MKKYLVIWAVAVCLLMTSALAASSEVPILMYHQVAENAGTSNLIVTPSRFREDMECLRDHGYTPLLTADLVNIQNGTEPMPDKPVMITFDDGYQDNYAYAYPILKETGMKATIAVISCMLRGVDDNGDSYGPAGFLSWAECKEMYQSGLVDIGSHTNNLHNPSTGGLVVVGGINGVQRTVGETQTDYVERVGGDLAYSKAAIERYVGNSVNYLAYPFGATDAWCNEIVGGLGYAVTTTTTTARADIANGLYNLPRIRISMSESVEDRVLQAESIRSSKATVSVNGTKKTVSTYVIHSNNYMKLRDVAALLNGTSGQVNVTWNSKQGVVAVTNGQAYQKVGGELAVGAGDTLCEKETLAQVQLNGTMRKVPAYLLHQNYYFKLRDLAQYFGISIDWNAASQTVVLETE